MNSAIDTGGRHIVLALCLLDPERETCKSVSRGGDNARPRGNTRVRQEHKMQADVTPIEVHIIIYIWSLKDANATHAVNTNGHLNRLL